MRFEPMPQATMPAPNHFFNDSSDASTPGPGHRPQDILDEFRPADAGTRKYLDDLAAQLLGGGDFRGRAAAGAVGNFAAVADLGDIGVEDRPDHELGAIGNEQARRRRIHHRTHAHDDAGIGLGEMARDLQKGLGREITAVGKLDALGAAVGAGLDHLEADFSVGMKKDRDHGLAHHRLQHRHTIVIHPTFSTGPYFCGVLIAASPGNG